MNGYEIEKIWEDFVFDNPSKIKPIHSALLWCIIRTNNRLGWKREFNFPRSQGKEETGIKNDRTYTTAFEDLEKWGFIKVVERSKNQFTANIISIFASVKYTKAKQKQSEGIVKSKAKAKQKQSEGIVDIHKTIQTNKTIETIENKEEFEISGFEKSLRKYFSQTTDVLQMRLSSFLRSLKNKGELDEFEKQTIAYVAYKKLSDEKVHSWQGYQAEWKNTDWVDKLSKQKNVKPKTYQVQQQTDVDKKYSTIPKI